MRFTTGRRRMAVAAISAAALLAAAACSDDGDGAEEPDPDEPITLTLHDFGGQGFGYTDLVQQYMTDHPNITIDYQTTAERYDDQYRPTILQQLDAGSAPDIIAIEEQAIGQFTALEGQLADLGGLGLESREADYPAWKYELGKTPDGTLVALGTDVGGMLLCYRTDLFEEAGLPTDREEVAALWPTWDAFEGVAQDFVDSGVDATFVDSVNQIFNIRLVQEAGAGDGTSYFDRESNYVAGQSPAVRTAFDFVSRLNTIGAIGTFQNFTPEWNTAQAEASFATMGCPAWMLGVVEGNSGEDNAGNWDVAPVPGGGGNWGGSWLAVTENSPNQQAAADLVNFLTGTDGQLGAWEAVSAYPSSPAAQQDPSVADSTNAYFNDAPVGQLIAASIQAYQPVFFGALHSAVRTEVENVLLAMVQGNVAGEEAFNQFVEAGQEVVDTEG
jgi:cellobiose transport system substrate-binding protein